MKEKLKEYNYVVQLEVSTDKEGYSHQKCFCTLPASAIIDMGLFEIAKDDRSVRVRYNKKTKTLIIQKKK